MAKVCRECRLVTDEDVEFKGSFCPDCVDDIVDAYKTGAFMFPLKGNPPLDEGEIIKAYVNGELAGSRFYKEN